MRSRPIPDFSGATYTQFAGNSHYNGLQMNYEHRFNAGLSVLGNFTWSNCMTNATGRVECDIDHRISAPVSCPGWASTGTYGRCDFDINKVVHLSGIYELPVGRGKRFLHDSGRVMNAVLGGWVTNWILTLQDGQPGTVPCATSTTSGFGCYAIKVAGQDPVRGTAQCEPVAKPSGICDAAGGNDDRADGLQPARRRAEAIRRPGIPPA